MSIFLSTFGAVAVLLGIGLVGFLIIKRRLLPEQAIDILAPLAIDISLPCLIFYNIIRSFSPQDNPDWWSLPIWWLGFLVTAALLTLFFSRISKKESRREFALTLFYQNGLFVPLPVIAGIFPDTPSNLIYLFLFMLFYPAFIFNTYYFFFSRKKIVIDWKKILNPVLIASILAIAIRYFEMHVYIPDFALTICKMLGNMAIPIITLILGASIYIDFKRKGSLYLKEIIKFVLVKNFVFPIIFLGLLLIVRPEYMIALVILVESAAPPLSSVPILAERAGGDRTIVNQFVLMSFAISLISIPLMVTLFSKYF